MNGATLVVSLIGSAVEFNGEILTAGSGSIICDAARELIARGHYAGLRLEAWRGGTLCLAGPLGAFAQVTVEARSDGRPTFRLWRTGPENSGTSPPVAQNNEAAITQRPRTISAASANGPQGRTA